MKRFTNGQRVFVRHDRDGEPIDRWCTVARLMRADDGAWIALDERHERCPFPENDETRSTHIMAYPDSCSPLGVAP